MALPPWRHSQPTQTMHATALNQASHGLRLTNRHEGSIGASFNTVGVRRGLENLSTGNRLIPSNATGFPPAVVPAKPKPTPPPSSTPKMAWPQEVRDYVQRSFDPDAYIPGIERNEVEQRLKSIINDAAEKGELFSVDWKTCLLPQQLIHQERRRALTMTSPPTVNDPYLAESHPSFASNTNQNTPSSDRKRKSGDVPLQDPDRTSPPPWRQNNIRNPFEDRLTYPNPEQADRLDKRQRKQNEKAVSKYNNDLERRKHRFQNGRTPQYTSDGAFRGSSPDESNQGPVVGICQKLEKKYFRLTSAPKPETVRPVQVLRQTLDHLKEKWKLENNYGYICDQFKSLRQDLTVQHIKTDFTVNVYEIHARIALEKGDLGEYNQCQTQLRALYSQNLGGNPAEFLAYRILYFIHTNNRTSMNDVLADLTATDKQQPAVAHALKVRSALALGNYHQFFQLYLDPPNMGAYLMDMFIQRERLAALANICKAYKPDVPMRFVTEELGFESDQECVNFIIDYNGQHLIDDREDGVRILVGKAGPLFDTARNTAFRKVDIKGQI